MRTTLKTYTVRQIVEGFQYNEFEGRGLFGLSGRLTIQPEYQRNYIYAEARKDIEVVRSLLAGYPLGLIYFHALPDGRFEVLDGQQRITSFGRYVRGLFGVRDDQGMEQYFDGLAIDLQRRILDAELLVYECSGEESEIKRWFQTINIAGVPLNDQELLNAVFSGPFVTAGRQEFSNSGNANTQKWAAYVKGQPNRQEVWERALQWVSAAQGVSVTDYLARHRRDTDIREVKAYFSAVIDWVATVFPAVEKEMRGLAWGRLYEAHHTTPYDVAKVGERVRALYADPFVTDKKGIFEYILGGEVEKKLLAVRFFDDPTRRSAYERQTDTAKAKGVSNCPHCAIGDNANRTRIWKLGDMEADHVTAWSRGGPTSLANCEMLCQTHNQAKGNR